MWLKNWFRLKQKSLRYAADQLKVKKNESVDCQVMGWKLQSNPEPHARKATPAIAARKATAAENAPLAAEAPGGGEGGGEGGGGG